MFNGCNVWSFLTSCVVGGVVIYVFHESIGKNKNPVMEVNGTTGDCKIYLNDDENKPALEN